MCIRDRYDKKQIKKKPNGNATKSIHKVKMENKFIIIIRHNNKRNCEIKFCVSFE